MTAAKHKACSNYIQLHNQKESLHK